MRKVAAILIVAVLLGAVGFLCLKVREFSDSEHERFQTALWRLKHLDTAFNEDVLEARFALLDNYDDFQKYDEQLKGTLDELKVAPAFISPSGRRVIERARIAYVSILNERSALLERFKSQNAMLANSRRYLPLALDQLASRLGDSPEDRELDAAVDGLTRATLKLLTNPEESFGEANTRMEALKDWCGRHPNHREVKFVFGLMQHSQSISRGSVEVDSLTRQLVGLPSDQGVQKLFKAYESDVTKALQRAQQYRVMLYAAAVLVLMGIAYTFWALRAANRQLEQRVEERTRELARTEERFRLITENAEDLIAILNPQGKRLYHSPSYSRLLGHPPETLAADNGVVDLVHPDDRKGMMTAIECIMESGDGQGIELRMRHRDGSWRTCDFHGVPFRNAGGSIESVLIVARDITERKEAENARQVLEVQLRQAQKLEAVGQLSAGIAHEINTPTQYVGDNTRFLRDSFASIAKVMQPYEELLCTVKTNALAPDQVASVERAVEANDIKYLFEQIPAAIQETLEGIDRVSKIVRAMKEFSHPGSKEKALADLNKAIETTVTVAHSEWKYVADVELELEPNLPSVPCFIGEFNQCILNLIVNASHAIADVIRDKVGAKGKITIKTRRDNDHVEVRVSDTGTGIPESARSRIFEPFFTTKDVGKGTGQGLSIVYGSIVKKHGGTAAFETESGKGTTFILRLPLSPRGDADSRASDDSSSRKDLVSVSAV
jgi:PAS domain S-box-containing protein